MKKLLFAALLTISVSVSAFAADVNKVNTNATKSFKSHFEGASQITWTSGDEYLKASFVLDNQRMEAFYNLNGEMIGTSKCISFAELPVSAKRSFAKKFNNYTVKESIRFEGTDETALYISAENDQETLILKVSDDNELTIFKKTKK